ncbi:hypothetical protein C0J52_02169 [Blattella germanica]|nr:hypothetical protein C0J52_02169 [Blattella germanica]
MLYEELGNIADDAGPAVSTMSSVYKHTYLTPPICLLSIDNLYHENRRGDPSPPMHLQTFEDMVVEVTSRDFTSSKIEQVQWELTAEYVISAMFSHLPKFKFPPSDEL